jgi:hypothetical protein
MLAEVKSDWEKAYQKRLEDLQKRESETSDRLERKRQDTDISCYHCDCGFTLFDNSAGKNLKIIAISTDSVCWPR